MTAHQPELDHIEWTVRSVLADGTLHDADLPNKTEWMARLRQKAHHQNSLREGIKKPSSTRLVWRRAGGEWMEGKPCAECGQPTTGLSSFCPNCHSNAFEGGADIG